jgi:hypothetical protein
MKDIVNEIGNGFVDGFTGCAFAVLCLFIVYLIMEFKAKK